MAARRGKNNKFGTRLGYRTPTPDAEELTCRFKDCGHKFPSRVFRDGNSGEIAYVSCCPACKEQIPIDSRVAENISQAIGITRFFQSRTDLQRIRAIDPDLLHDATVDALLSAATRYDPSHAAKLGTVTYRWIEGFIANRMHSIKKRQYKKIGRLFSEIPVNNSVWSDSGTDEFEVSELVTDDPNLSTAKDVNSLIENEVLRSVLAKVIKAAEERFGLNAHEKTVVYRYMLEGIDMPTQAEMDGCSRQNIQRVWANGINKLQRAGNVLLKFKYLTKDDVPDSLAGHAV